MSIIFFLCKRRLFLEGSKNKFDSVGSLQSVSVSITEVVIAKVTTSYVMIAY